MPGIQINRTAQLSCGGTPGKGDSTLQFYGKVLTLKVLL